MPLVITGAGVARAIAVAVAVVLVAALVLLAASLLPGEDPFGDVVDESKVQAVVLSNDSVFFGNLRVASDDFFELRDVYFLQQSVEGEDTVGREAISLTEQIHGPEDRMLISRDEVVAIENLAADSEVLEQIEQND